VECSRTWRGCWPGCRRSPCGGIRRSTWVDILREPADWSAFARELYDFCPDIVEQGAGAVEELEAAIRELRQVLLWWD
jgi:hypothetical protein